MANGFKVGSAVSALDKAEAADELAAQWKESVPAPKLIALFGSPSRDLAAIGAALRAKLPEAVVIGASTAGEFTERGDRAGTVCALALDGDFQVAAVMSEGLRDDVESCVARALDGLPKRSAEHEHRTGLLLVDALAGGGEEASLLIAGAMPDISLAGGAAGDDLAMTATQVVLGDKQATNALVLAVLDTHVPLGIGVAHGHRPLSKTIKVTKAKDNVLVELDGRPAWDVWKDATREHAKKEGIDVDALEGRDVGAFLLRFEAGLSLGGGRYKIRAPLTLQEDGSIACACGIPEGAEIQITESNQQGQVDSAEQAARLARAALGGKAVAGALVFDCICRKLILGDRFDEAISSIGSVLGGVPLAGFETYGEIAMGTGELSGFHNTTTVVLALPDG